MSGTAYILRFKHGRPVLRALGDDELSATPRSEHGPAFPDADEVGAITAGLGEYGDTGVPASVDVLLEDS